MASNQTPAGMRTQAKNLLKRAQQLEKSRNTTRNTFSKMVMAGIMMMFFVGVALGCYVTIWRGEPVSTTLDYIMQLAKIVSLGYFVKAFGENIAKILLPYIFVSRIQDNNEGVGTE